MEKPVEKSRQRWADLMSAEMRRLSEIAAGRMLYGRYSCPHAKWIAGHKVKYQCFVSLEEAAALEAIRLSTMPGISRYGMVRGLLLALIRAKEKEGNEEKGSCCHQGSDGGN